MSEPQISVVIPAYNGARTVAATIDSVLRQSREDFELIVVDDGSTDETADLVEDLLRGDPRARLVRQPNGGTAAARNMGLAQARGELVSFLDNDDLWMPEYLARMSAALEREPGAGLSYTDAWILDDRTKRVRTKTALQFFPTVNPRAPAATVLRALLKTNFIMSSVTARRQALEEVGGFDPELSGVDDYDLWIRVVATGRTAVRAEGVLQIQRDRPDSQSKDVLGIIEGHCRVLRRARENPELDPDARLLAERELRGFERWAAALRGEDRLQQALYWLRGLLAALRDRVGRQGRWPPEPPAEVARAFPNLRLL
jgi:glycosyltransferase involved in cell wall biosynthesis